MEPTKEWHNAEKKKFTGWDFSSFEGKITQPDPEWDYIKIAKAAVKSASVILDMETGGGEILASILSKENLVGKKIYATENYLPNIEIATKNLNKFGVDVVKSDTAKMPFADGMFDLVLNRHGGLNPIEVSRVVGTNGLFVSQQVSYRNLFDLQNAFSCKSKWPENNLKTRTEQFEEEGFKIIQKGEWTGKMVVKEVTALVYFLKAIPWIVEGFRVDKHLSVLKKFQKKIDTCGKLTFTLKRFLIVAKKEV